MASQCTFYIKLYLRLNITLRWARAVSRSIRAECGKNNMRSVFAKVKWNIMRWCLSVCVCVSFHLNYTRAEMDSIAFVQIHCLRWAGNGSCVNFIINNNSAFTHSFRSSSRLPMHPKFIIQLVLRVGVQLCTQ